KPRGIIVRAPGAAPDGSFGISKSESGFHSAFGQLRFPSRRERSLPRKGHIFLEGSWFQLFAMPDARSTQRRQIEALSVIVEINRLDRAPALRVIGKAQSQLLLSRRP